MSAPIHPTMEPLTGILGTWEGVGSGDYPTIDPFTYVEQVTFSHVGKPFFAYVQRTWNPVDLTPMHAETGYLRLAGDESGEVDGLGTIPLKIEFMVAHPTGIVEVEQGSFQAGVLRCATSAIGLAPTAKPVHSVRREFRLEGQKLLYDLWMAHADTPETHHLRATLNRTA